MIQPFNSFGALIKWVKLNSSWTVIVAIIDGDMVQRGSNILIEYEFDWSFEYLKFLYMYWNLGIQKKD